MKTYRFFLEDIKQDLYDKIKKNPYYASKLIEKLRLNKREIPDELLNLFLHNPAYLDTILRNMIADSDWKTLNNPIIKKILEQHAVLSFDLFELLYDYHIEKLEQLFNNKNPFLYALYKGISKDSVLSKKLMVKYAGKMIKVNFDTGEETSRFKFPTIILNSINDEMATAYEFAQILLDKDKKVPESTMKKLATSVVYSIQIALYYNKEKNRNVPEIILKTIADHKRGTLTYYQYLIERNLPVPKIIIDALDKWGGPGI